MQWKEARRGKIFTGQENGAVKRKPGFAGEKRGTRGLLKPTL
jgi:hypothetical protein